MFRKYYQSSGARREVLPMDKKNIVHLIYIVSAIVLFFILNMIQSYNYLLFHSIAEIVSSCSSMLIFIIVLSVWEHIKDDNYLSLLGIGFFFIGMIDLLHMLTYKGMNIFQGFDGNVSIQLWIVARYIQAFSLLIGAILMKGKYQIHKGMVFSIYTVVVVFLLNMILGWRTFPQCFIEGYGLTTFKIVSEYIIVIILIISGIIMQKRKGFFSPVILRLLLGSILLEILAGFSFTTYISMYEFSNFIGHYFKMLSIMVFCKAILVIALASPSQLLYEKLERLNVDLEQVVEERTIQLKGKNAELEEMNDILEKKIVEGQKIEEIIRELNDGLEDNVQQRTAALMKSE